MAVRKVPTQTQYADKDKDEIQRQADRIKGFRYYLPRPYIAIKKEFPIGGTTHLIPAKIDSKTGAIRLVLDKSLQDQLNAMQGVRLEGAPVYARPEVAEKLNTSSQGELTGGGSLSNAGVPKRITVLANAVTVKDGHLANIAHGQASARFSLEIDKTVLAADQLTKAYIRGFFLLPIERDNNGVVNVQTAAGKRIPLSMANYQPGDTKGTYTLQGPIAGLAGKSGGAYVFAVLYYENAPGGCQLRLAFNPANSIAVAVGEPHPKGLGIGADDLAGTDAQANEGLTITSTPPRPCPFAQQIRAQHQSAVRLAKN